MNKIIHKYSVRFKLLEKLMFNKKWNINLINIHNIVITKLKKILLVFLIYWKNNI